MIDGTAGQIGDVDLDQLRDAAPAAVLLEVDRRRDADRHAKASPSAR